MPAGQALPFPSGTRRAATPSSPWAVAMSVVAAHCNPRGGRAGSGFWVVVPGEYICKGSEVRSIRPIRQG
jgi:hypothetical protein